MVLRRKHVFEGVSEHILFVCAIKTILTAAVMRLERDILALYCGQCIELQTSDCNQFRDSSFEVRTVSDLVRSSIKDLAHLLFRI